MSASSISKRPSLSIPSLTTSSLCNGFNDPFWNTPYPTEKPTFNLVNFLSLKYRSLAAHYQQKTQDGSLMIDLVKRRIDSFLEDFFSISTVIETLQKAHLTIPQFMVFLALADLGAKEAAQNILVPGRLRNAYCHAYSTTLFAAHKKALNLPEDERFFSFLFMQDALIEYLEHPSPTQDDASEAAFVIIKQSHTFCISLERSFSLLILFYQITQASALDTRTRSFKTDLHHTVRIGSTWMPTISGLLPEYVDKINQLTDALNSLKLSLSQTTGAAQPPIQTPCSTKEERLCRNMQSIPFRVYRLWKKGLKSFAEISDHPEKPARFSHYLMKFALMNAAISSITVQQTLSILSKTHCLWPTTSATLALMSKKNHFVVERLGDALKAKAPPMHDISNDYIGFNDPRLWRIRVYPIDQFKSLTEANPIRPFTAFKAMQATNPFYRMIPHNRISLHHLICLLSAWKKQRPQSYQQLLSPDNPRTRQLMTALSFLKNGFQHPSNGTLDALHKDPSSCTSCEIDSSNNKVIINMINELTTFLSTGEDKERVMLFEITDQQLNQLETDLKHPYRHLSKESTWMHTAIILRQLKQWNPALFHNCILPADLTEWMNEIHKEHALLQETLETALRLIQHPFKIKEFKLIRGPLEKTFDLTNEQDSRFFSNLNLLFHQRLANFSSKSLTPPAHLFTDFSPGHIQKAIRFYRKNASLWPHLLKRFLNIKLFQMRYPEKVSQENLNQWLYPLEHELRDLNKGHKNLISAFSDEPLIPPLTSPEVRTHIQSPTPIVLGSTSLIPRSHNQKAYLYEPAPLSAHAWNIIFVQDQTAEDQVRTLLPPHLLEEISIYQTTKLNTGGMPLIYGPSQMSYAHDE